MSDRDKPLVSVILAVYNAERYLAFALESVRSQTYAPVEIIVVDDGSSDGSADIARSYVDVRYISQTNQGPAAARNTGLDVARGELLAFLDADDRWPHDKLEIQVRHHLGHPEVGYSIGHMRTFLEPGIERPPWLHKKFLEADQVGFLVGALMARRDVFERVGTFDVSCHGCEGANWFIRAKDSGIPMTILPDVFLERRIHDNNLTYNYHGLNANIARFLKASLDRKRAAHVGPDPKVDDEE